jgi:hypothetical protein
VATQLVVRIQVGDDDIRGDTQVIGFIRLSDNTKLELEPIGSLNVSLSQSREIPNGSLLNIKVSLVNAQGAALAVHVKDIRVFHIEHSTTDADGLAADNWNMNAIRVIYPKDPSLNPPVATTVDWSKYDQLFFGSGSPYLHRFKQNCQSDGGPDWDAFH